MAASTHSIPMQKVSTVVSSKHGSRPSRWTREKHHKGSWLLSQRGLFSCQRGFNCEGGANWNTPAMCRHRYSFHMGIFSPSVVQRSKQTRSIWVSFMTHFGKFAGGYFKRPYKTCSAACKTTPLSLISNRNIKEFSWSLNLAPGSGGNAHFWMVELTESRLKSLLQIMPHMDWIKTRRT